MGPKSFSSLLFGMPCHKGDSHLKLLHFNSRYICELCASWLATVGSITINRLRQQHKFVDQNVAATRRPTVIINCWKKEFRYSDDIPGCFAAAREASWDLGSRKWLYWCNLRVNENEDAFEGWIWSILPFGTGLHTLFWHNWPWPWLETHPKWITEGGLLSLIWGMWHWCYHNWLIHITVLKQVENFKCDWEVHQLIDLTESILQMYILKYIYILMGFFFFGYQKKCNNDCTSCTVQIPQMSKWVDPQLLHPLSLLLLYNFNQSPVAWHEPSHLFQSL